MIAKARGLIVGERALMSLASTQKYLLHILYDQEVLDENVLAWLEGECPWCGSNSMEYGEIRTDSWG